MPAFAARSSSVRVWVGKSVSVKSSVSKPQYGWGSVSAGDVGVVTGVANSKMTVDFPAQKGWSGKVDEMEEVASSGGSSAPRSRRPVVGDSVVLTSDFASHDDAAGGPLTLGGGPGKLLVDDGSGKPFKVKAASCGTEWWYTASAIQKA